MKLYNQFQYEKIREFYIKYSPGHIREFIDPRKNIGFPNYYKNSDVIFIHIPKSAGSSIAKMLYGQTIDHMSADFFQRANASEFNKKTSFAIVRDPWERALSAYNFLSQGGTDLVPVENKKKYEKYNTFEAFVNEYLIENFNSNLDYVLREQHKFIYRDDECLVEHLGKLESLHETIAWLESKTGKKYTVPKYNASKSKPSDEGNQYTPKLINIIGDLYEKDIRILGY